MPRMPRAIPTMEDDPLWYRDAVIYELHVRTFYDSDGDGIGDFQGVARKLDYLQDLGVTTLWLLPFYPSPLKDDGYDIADYNSIHPHYGTMQDFRHLLQEAHKRGLHVITEMVLNHTSDQHPWFQRARRAQPGSQRRDFYVWSQTAEKYNGARIIFKDFETSNWTFDPVAGAYYWHRFYSHQPDLNFDSPGTRRAVLRAVDFWLDMGVSGLRLDAVPYLYERDGTNCENLPETHAFIKELRSHVDARYKNRILLGEANQWSEDAVAYFGNGDECHMAFHFPVMPRLFMALQMESSFPIVDILQQTPPIPEHCQWALFLRNHDELTLEMVTDEERGYMYRAYAYHRQMRVNLGIRRRLAPLLHNDRKKIELMNALLLSLPGAPVIYYGDEIGMGDNIYLGDRNGVRTPMQWSPDRNAGFSQANSQQLYLPVNIDPQYHYEAVNVDIQQGNSDSLLWWMKRIIALRKRFKAFGRGSLEFLESDNPKVLSFLRRYEDETILVVANLSRLAQHAHLGLSQWAGYTPAELFGQTEFPSIGERPYPLALGPHGFYWFALTPQRRETIELHAGPPAPEEVPTLTLRGEGEIPFRREDRAALSDLLLDYMKKCRWFGGKARAIQSVEIQDVVPVGHGQTSAHFVFLAVEYIEGEPETYLLPLAIVSGEEAHRITEKTPQALVAHLEVISRQGRSQAALCDALAYPGFCSALLDASGRRHRYQGELGEILIGPTQAYRATRGPSDVSLEPTPLSAEQSNTSVVFGNRLLFKLYRRLGEGLNPDLEIGRFLTEKTSFAYTAPVAGALEYRKDRTEDPMTLGILLGYVPAQADGWRYTLDALGHYLEHTLAHPEVLAPPIPGESLVTLAGMEPPREVRENIGPYLASAELLGQRTAELHVALASDFDDPSFSPEPFSSTYQRSLYHAMRGFTIQVFALLRQQLPTLPQDAQENARQVLRLEEEIIRRFHALVQADLQSRRIRIHGDYHLGQVLYTGTDFIIIDFEGEPARPLGERRLKRSPLRDVAGMIRSFHYASHAALAGQAPGVLRAEDRPLLLPWAQIWYQWVSASFLKSYLDVQQHTGLLPADGGELEVLLGAYLLEKAVYEVGYELNHRPDWVNVPLQGILHMVEGTA